MRIYESDAKIFVITGPDGSGKSTLCRNTVKLINSHLGDRGAIHVSLWDSILESSLKISKEDLIQYLATLEGYTRTLFIFHALSRSVDLAIKKNPKFIIIESYWYKYAVTEIAQGVHQDSVLAASKGFLNSNLTFCLDLSPEIAWTRKQEVSQYEQGRNTTGTIQERFIQFQTQLIPIWKTIENITSPWIHFSSLQPKNILAETLAKEVMQYESS